MGAHLQEEVVAILDELVDRGGEPDGVPHVVPPVGGPYLPSFQGPPGHGGVQGHCRRPRLQVVQGLQQLALQRVHVVAVIGDLHLEEAMEDVVTR